MDNVDFPMGFKFAYTKHGGPPRLTKYLSTAAIIYPGDTVYKDGSGRILSVTDDQQAPIGVAANYVPAVADSEVFVYDDLTNTIFEVQVDDGTLTDDTANGNFFDQTVVTGDTVRRTSKHELNGDSSAEDTLVLEGLVNRPGNAWGLNCNVLVSFRVDSQTQVIAAT